MPTSSTPNAAEIEAAVEKARALVKEFDALQAAGWGIKRPAFSDWLNRVDAARVLLHLHATLTARAEAAEATAGHLMADMMGMRDGALVRDLQTENAALAARVATLEAALRRMIAVANEARDQWDIAPSHMKAGKLLIALSGKLPGYRADIDAIHAALTPSDGGGNVD